MNIMFRNSHVTTTIALWTTLFSFIVAVVVALCAAIVGPVVEWANESGLAVEADVSGMLATSCVFLVVTAFGAAVTWVSNNTDFTLDLPEVELSEVRIARAEAVTA